MLATRLQRLAPTRGLAQRIGSSRFSSRTPPAARNNFLAAPPRGTRQQPRGQQGPRRLPTPLYVWVTAGGAVLLVGGTYLAFLDRVPLTNRRRWIATDPQVEQELGDLEFQQLLRHFRKDILPASHRASRTVQRVGARIAAAAQDFMQAQQGGQANRRYLTLLSRPYTFTVVQSDMANAFCLPGNHVFVMTGLFRYARTEDELAAVLGHEIAHNLARHAGEKMSGSMVVNLLARLSLLVDPTGVLAMMLLPAATVFRELPHSRVQELEADEIGVHLAARACYDPRASRRVFLAMKEGLDDGPGAAAPPEFLSTHPSHESRLANFDVYLPEVTERYLNDSRCQILRQQMERARQAAAREALLRERQAAAQASGWYEL